MAAAALDGRELLTPTGFHRASRAAFGFPDFYGNNFDAWIDCMSGLRNGDGMTRFTLAADEMLDIIVSNAGILQKSAPDLLESLQQCVAEVNLRCEEAGQPPMLSLQLR
jgi:hypothetical protein